MASPQDYGSTAVMDTSLSIQACPTHSDTDSGHHEERISFSDLGIHQQPSSMETCCGQTRHFSTISCKEWIFLASSTLSILAAAGLTIERLATVPVNSPYFTFSVVVMINICFVLCYVINGVFTERSYEIFIFIVGTLILMIECILNFAVTINSPDMEKYERRVKLTRMIILLVMGLINIIFGAIMSATYWSSTDVVFRCAGALVDRQGVYSRMCFSASMLKIDLQLELSLVVLALKSGQDANPPETVILTLGISYVSIWTVCGVLAMTKDSKRMVYVVLGLSWCEPAYIVYRFVDIGIHWATFSISKVIPAASIVFGIFGLVVRVTLCGALVSVYRNFGKGMKGEGRGITPLL
ncbi:uncharacterized protein LOC110986583 isoform X2 [Acanthaster planci]|uniref:Uncharacterized protein LOC110986583 isoform X2 n=1 Tax=Acanthaster planci TaxID=133434 RepID=A0A8B7ZF42_ACAPL|nr:uncharacterized protein LOC110986583 isoform X2 [Acanthaster planci]